LINISLFRSLRSRLTVAFFGLAVGPILVVGLVLSFKSINSLKNGAIIHQQIEAERISIAVEDYVRELERVLELTSKAHGFMSLLRSEQQTILEELIAYENRFEALTLVDSVGSELIRSNRIQVVTQAALVDRTNDPVFLQAVNLKKNYFSPVQFDIVTGEPHITIAIPLQSFQTGDIEYVLLGSVRLKKIWDLLASISHANQSIFIVDGKGRIIGHPDPSVTLSGQKFQIPEASSGVGTGLNGGEVVLATKRLVFGEQSIYIVAQKEIAKALHFSREIIYITLLVVVIALVLAALLSSLVIGAIIHPLEHLASTARTIQQGDLEQQVEYGRNDEVGELGKAFNGMTMRLRSTIENLENEIVERNNEIAERKKAEQEKKELTKQLQQSQKMEAVGQLAGGVAHDFNNMLGVILGHAEMVMEQIDPDDPILDNMKEIRKAARRSADITHQLLAFARKQTVAPKVIDLNETIEGMLKMLRRLIGENIDFAWLPGAGLWTVKIDPSQIDQILVNLCVNARAAISGVGKISVETGNDTFDEEYCAIHQDCVVGEYVCITVSDSGAGMDQETLEHVFEPFFTTKGVGEGTGLGLATVFGSVKQNNGFINVYSEPGMGTTFRIYLPHHVGKTEQVSCENTVDPVHGGTETILLVEDEATILEMTTSMLQRLGYKVLTAGTPREAIDMVGELTSEIHLLLTDVIMPEMNGRDLADNLLSNLPQLKCLFMSGYTSDIITKQGILADGVHFIQKPFSKKDLASKIRIVLEKN